LILVRIGIETPGDEDSASRESGINRVCPDRVGLQPEKPAAVPDTGLEMENHLFLFKKESGETGLLGITLGVLAGSGKEGGKSSVIKEAWGLALDAEAADHQVLVRRHPIADRNRHPRTGKGG
jgi:hypothetical protein